LKIGTKSVLFGAHCFFLHPWFVALAWWKLYGFPWNPRLWVAFFVHDIGYLGKPNMDGEEGELHPYTGARIMRFLFDSRYSSQWHDFCLFHSRYLAKRLGGIPSRLCFADKLSFCYTPRWLYLPMVTLTGEVNEYLKNAQTADSSHWKPTGYDKKRWHKQLCEYMRKWVYEHIDGRVDTWTSVNRHARTESGVWQQNGDGNQ
jgi:hypothetical protein